VHCARTALHSLSVRTLDKLSLLTSILKVLARFPSEASHYHSCSCFLPDQEPPGLYLPGAHLPTCFSCAGPTLSSAAIDGAGAEHAHCIVASSNSASEPTMHVSQVLVLESSVPMFTVALAASVPLALLDVPSNVAILSRCAPDPENGNATLATYR
jgi:hypothetical protein